MNFSLNDLYASIRRDGNYLIFLVLEGAEMPLEGPFYGEQLALVLKTHLYDDICEYRRRGGKRPLDRWLPLLGEHPEDYRPMLESLIAPHLDENGEYRRSPISVEE